MPFLSGKVIVTAGSATPLVAPRFASAVTVQNMGSAAVTIGGPGVTAGEGIVLASGALPIAIQATHHGNVEDLDDSLYGIATSGSATVGFIHGW
jgi:hypothetical protein